MSPAIPKGNRGCSQSYQGNDTKSVIDGRADVPVAGAEKSRYAEHPLQAETLDTSGTKYSVTGFGLPAVFHLSPFRGFYSSTAWLSKNLWVSATVVVQGICHPNCSANLSPPVDVDSEFTSPRMVGGWPGIVFRPFLQGFRLHRLSQSGGFQWRRSGIETVSLVID